MNHIETPKSLNIPDIWTMEWDPKLEELVEIDSFAVPMMSFDPTSVPDEADQSSDSLINWTEIDQIIERNDEESIYKYC